ncbi:MAG: helix-turn-helix domain-containing protein [Thermoflexales bacterium]|nr:helix-turn-helix domain-containing protein [Thermoflexales bacterium]
MSDDLLQRVVPPPEPAGPGFRLRAAREARGLSYQDVEAATRIRTRYLEALETGKYDVMPGGEAQVRGFLRRYAAFLNIPPEEIIALYERETHREAVIPAPVPAPAPSPSPKSSPPVARPVSPELLSRRGMSTPALLGLLILIGALALGAVWLATHSDQIFSGPRATPTAGVPRPAAFPSPMVTATPASPTVVPTPAATPTFPVSTSGVTLTLEAQEHVWVRVTVDGFTAFEGMLSPGAPQTWVGQEMVIVETGNGAGVIAIVNGQSQGPLCGRGEVCARGWGPEGEIPEVTR